MRCMKGKLQWTGRYQNLLSLYSNFRGMSGDIWIVHMKHDADKHTTMTFKDYSILKEIKQNKRDQE